MKVTNGKKQKAVSRDMRVESPSTLRSLRRDELLPVSLPTCTRESKKAIGNSIHDRATILTAILAHDLGWVQARKLNASKAYRFKLGMFNRR